MEDQVNLKDILNRISVKLRFNQKLLEKDYHLTKILQRIANEKIEKLVFKGGTYLNKCYLGFYRLSDDLDFVYNKDLKGISKTQVKKVLLTLKSKLFNLIKELDLKINNELGKGWKLITSDSEQKFIGLEIIVFYNSIIDNSKQQIKIEISYRNKLKLKTNFKIIKHEFYDELNEPLLPINIKIESISLKENYAEKFRALVTRKNIAVRDLYDIYYISKNKKVLFDNSLINLILKKINETIKFTKKDFFDFMNNLPNKIKNLNENSLLAVLKTDININMEKIIKEINNLKLK